MASSKAHKFDQHDRRPNEQRGEVAALSRILMDARTQNQSLYVVGPQGETVMLPASVVDVFERATALLSRGEAVAILPVGKDITSQKAADLLDVSRQYLVALVNDGRIPCSKTGKHRRLRIEDVLAFKRVRTAERLQALAELANLTLDFGGYEREMKWE